MKVKHVGFTVEVLQDQGTRSIGTVTKFFVTKGARVFTKSM